jgi:heterodisulfide reductase subunit D
LLENFQDDLLKCNFQKCADCKNGCPVYERLGFISNSARGRMNVLKAVKENFIDISPSVIELIYKCALCGYCQTRCSNNIELTELFRSARNFMTQTNKTRDLNHQEYINFLMDKGNPYGKPKADRQSLFENYNFSKDSHRLFYAGCSAIYIEPQVGKATASILSEDKNKFNYLGENEFCCGNLLYTLGYRDKFIETAKSNLEVLKQFKIKEIVTPCPGCYRIFNKVYPEFVEWPKIKVLHISQFIFNMIRGNKISLNRHIHIKSAYHDPCDLGRGMGVFEQPRQILRKIPGLELIEFEDNMEKSHCCGGGGGLLISDKNLAFSIAESRVKEIEEKGIDTIISSCPLCVSILRKAVEFLDLDISVKDLSVIVADAAGLK